MKIQVGGVNGYEISYRLSARSEAGWIFRVVLLRGAKRAGYFVPSFCAERSGLDISYRPAARSEAVNLMRLI